MEAGVSLATKVKSGIVRRLVMRAKVFYHAVFFSRIFRSGGNVAAFKNHILKVVTLVQLFLKIDIFLEAIFLTESSLKIDFQRRFMSYSALHYS
jgi:hypothetical protein